MEDCENIFQKQQVICKTKIKVGKPPTRLQLQAPSSLDLHDVGTNNGFITNQFSPSRDTPLTAIPLLSPLVVSPQAVSMEAEEFKFPKFGSTEMGPNNDDKKGVIIAAIPGGWQHPAVAGYTEPSDLFSFFQSKCVLVNDAQ